MKGLSLLLTNYRQYWVPSKGGEMKYAFRADITWMVEHTGLELAYREAIRQLPNNAVILSLSGWPADTGQHAAGVDDLADGLRRLGETIDKLK